MHAKQSVTRPSPLAGEGPTPSSARRRAVLYMRGHAITAQALPVLHPPARPAG